MVGAAGVAAVHARGTQVGGWDNSSSSSTAVAKLGLPSREVALCLFKLRLLCTCCAFG